MLDWLVILKEDLQNIIIDIIEQNTSKKAIIEFTNSEPAFFIADSEKLYNEINFKPRITINEGIVEMLNDETNR